MGLSFKKSIKAGPFRFNLSSSGVGVSVGVPGFRVGTGPRGNYISMSGGGFTYRKSMGPVHPHGTPAPVPMVPTSPDESEPRQGQRFISSGCTTVAPLQIIQSADVRQLSDVDSADLVEEINGKRRKFAVWYLPLVLLCVLWFNVLSASATPNPLWIGALGVLSVAVVASSYCGCTCGTKPAAARFSSTISTIARSGHMSVSWMASLR